MTTRSGKIESGCNVANFVTSPQDTMSFRHQPASRGDHPDEREPWLVVSHYDSSAPTASKGITEIWLRPADALAIAEIMRCWATMAERVPIETRWLDGDQPGKGNKEGK